MARYFLHLSYDGSNYSGWQIQPNAPTVQEVIAKALKILVKDLKGVIGCGRTDTGVHAREYYLHFETGLPLYENLVYKLNAILPLDIAIHDCMAVSDRTHARFSATKREYEYFVHFSKDPFVNKFSVFHPKPLQMDRMNEGAQYLIGEHDFTSFSKSQTQTKTNLCRVDYAKWEETESGMVFRISANRFLRNMVRAVVGTLFLVGEGEMEPNHVKTVMDAMDRSKAGKSAHPQGLFLNKITYPELNGSSIR